MMRRSIGSVLASMVCLAAVAQVGAWQIPGNARMLTQWAQDVTPDNVWNIYPRPQMKRPASSWKNLNGIWQFQRAASMTEALPSGNLSGEILVPFCIESALSGVMASGDNRYIYSWYKKNFTLPEGWNINDHKFILHIGASDFRTQVFVNGSIMAEHYGGYDHFSVDITSKLKNNGTGEQQIAVRVYDPTDKAEIGGLNPKGKQVVYPNGIFYSGCSGIWQTVWLEAVPKEAYISSLKITPLVDQSKVRVTVNLKGTTTGMKVYAFAKNKGKEIWGGDSINAAGSVTMEVALSAVNLWWPERPFLYDLGIYLKKGPAFVDSVQSYFAMRKIEAVKVGNVMEAMLNGKAQFLFGPLDQGYWPDGIYTAPTYEALLIDIIKTKEMGFNCTRKHVKTEPDVWYHACDSLGLMVWQDMPNPNAVPSATGKQHYEAGMDSLVSQLYNFPSIIMWVVWNEGWGQYDTDRLTKKVMAADPTRLVHCATGWTWSPVGHLKDNHSYPHCSPTPVDPNYICGNGEYGGLLVKVPGHEWDANLSFGYGGNNTAAEALNLFTDFIDDFVNYKASRGCRTAIYTEIADAEIECNGFLTYDRIMKFKESDIRTQVLRLVDANTPAALVNPSRSIPDKFFDATAIAPVSTATRAAMVRIASVSVGSERITIALDATPQGETLVQLVDANGRIISQHTAQGSRLITVTSSSLAKGVYFVKLQAGSIRQTVRCMVM